MKNNICKISVLLFIIFLVGVFLRINSIQSVPPGLHGDEAYNGVDALLALMHNEFRLFYPGSAGREGLFIALQAAAISMLGVEVHSLRMPSVVVGSLTIPMVFFATREAFLFFSAKDKDSDWLARVNTIALFAAFLIAASYWHVNFSRIGYRGILDPFFTTASLYLFMSGLRRNSMPVLVLAGLVTGVGLYGYLTHKFVIFPLLYAALYYHTRFIANGARNRFISIFYNRKLLLFAVAVLITGGWYLYMAVGHPDQIFQRAGQVNVFGQYHAAEKFLLSLVAVAQMFFFVGDLNWRHNLSGLPMLHPLVMVAFAMGMFVLSKVLYSHRSRTRSELSAEKDKDNIVSVPLCGFLIVWWAAMLLPAVLTWQSPPHALRTINVIPPTMLIAAIGAVYIWEAASMHSVTINNKRWRVAVLLVFSLIASSTYITYFGVWATRPQTYDVFMSEEARIAQEINAMPVSVEKYVVLNRKRSSSAAYQAWSVKPIVYITNTPTPELQKSKNIHYIVPRDIPGLASSANDRVFYIMDIPAKDVNYAIRRVAPNAEIKEVTGAKALSKYKGGDLIRRFASALSIRLDLGGDQDAM